jgi:antitoxin component of MazEF toxin-antitoxin module
MQGAGKEIGTGPWLLHFPKNWPCNYGRENMVEPIMRSQKIIKQGNSAALRIGQETLRAANLEIGRSVKVSASADGITITPVSEAYDQTRESAARMSERYRKTLELFGR